jgi:hypothetical protein
MAFFVAGGMFASNVETPEAMNTVGGICFFGWWVPALAAFCLQSRIRRLEIGSGFASATIIGCGFTLLGSALFFTAALKLTSGPVSPEAKALGDFCLAVWWIPAVSGVVLVFMAIVRGIEGKESK